MKFANLARQHWAALRALLVFTMILGVGYPLLIWLVAQLPGLHPKAAGSLIWVDGEPVGSMLIGQSFTDPAGRALPQYFQSRPSAAGAGYDLMASGGSNLGPESIVDTPAHPSLLTLVCSRSKTVAERDGLGWEAGARPFCTRGGVGAVLSVIGPRDARGNVVHPDRVVSVNESCATTGQPFLAHYQGVRVECAAPGEEYAIGQIVPIRGAAPGQPRVPADAVTASGSGLDPDISPANAEIQLARVAAARRATPERIRDLVRAATSGRGLGVFGEPRVNVLRLNLALDDQFPLPSG
jgi:K+-transporting ATPase ATPase C chain